VQILYPPFGSDAALPLPACAYVAVRFIGFKYTNVEKEPPLPELNILALSLSMIVTGGPFNGKGPVAIAEVFAEKLGE